MGPFHFNQKSQNKTMAWQDKVQRARSNDPTLLTLRCECLAAVLVKEGSSSSSILRHLYFHITRQLLTSSFL